MSWKKIRQKILRSPLCYNIRPSYISMENTLQLGIKAKDESFYSWKMAEVSISHIMETEMTI